jgi:hypothetical protein
MPDDLKDAMLCLRKNRATAQAQGPSPKATKPEASVRARATKAKPKPAAGKAKTEPAQASAAALTPEIVGDDGKNGIKETDLKGQLTLKELRFIELYLTGDLTFDKAMESAGYVGYHPNSLYRLGRKIVQKYESQAGDRRKIMRTMGYGEIRIIELLIDSAENAKSEMVKLNARIALAKCLGLQKEVVEVGQSVKIIINAANGESLKVGVCAPASPSNDLHQAISIKD